MSVCTTAIVAAKNAVATPIERDHLRGLGRVQIDAGQPRDHVDAGGHHRRRVDQRRDRRRAGHRVGQPDVQRDLRRLAGGADEQQDADEARGDRGRAPLGERGVDAVHVERADRLVEQEHAEQEAGVADAVGDERLLAGAALSASSNQKPISRYEARPTPSQPTNSTSSELARAPAAA